MREKIMRICLVAFLLMLATTAYAQYVSPAIDFFMQGRQYDTFLRDYFQFNEPKPFRIDYNYVKWLDTNSDASDYADNLHLETALPIYASDRVAIDIPFYYSRLPVWAEKDNMSFGDDVNILSPSILLKLTLSDKLKSTVGVEYNIKGDSDTFGKLEGKMVCIPELILSYELFKKLNFMIGGRLERYYFDTEETDLAVKLDDQLYFRPIGMINWHPSNRFKLLLGIPYSGISIDFNSKIKAEARVSTTKSAEVALRIKPVEKTNISLRFINSPYIEIPVFGLRIGKDEPLDGRFSSTRQSMIFEVGRELNPAALASLAAQYSPGSDLTFNATEKYKLDCKPNFAIGVRFTVDVKALLQIK
jgi:hypothetical protein